MLDKKFRERNLLTPQ